MKTELEYVEKGAYIHKLNAEAKATWHNSIYIACKVSSFDILSILNYPTDYICRHAILTFHNTVIKIHKEMYCANMEKKILLKFRENIYEMIQNIFCKKLQKSFEVVIGNNFP